MFRTKQSRTEAAVDQARSTAADLGSAAGDRIGSLNDSAADTASDAAAAAKDRAYAAKEAATPACRTRPRRRASGSTTRRRPRQAKVEAAQSTLVDNVLPKVGAAIATAAAALAAGAEQAREAAQPHLEQAAAQAKETAAVGGHRAHDAYAVLKGDAVAKQRGGKGKWLIAIGLTAAAVAAVAAFRKQKQADDPWATPLDSRAAARVAHGRRGRGDAQGQGRRAGRPRQGRRRRRREQGQGEGRRARRRGQGQGRRPRRQGPVRDRRRQGPLRRSRRRRDAHAVADAADDPAPGRGHGGRRRAPDSDAITSEAVEGGTINGASTKASPRGSAKAKLAENGDSAS